MDRIENIAVPSTDKIGRRRVFFWPQNRMPEKFWEFVDEFVPALGADDLAQLSQMLKEMSEDRLGKYLRMPGQRGESAGVGGRKDENRRGSFTLCVFVNGID